MPRVVKDAEFAKSARKSSISDTSLMTAVSEVERGLVDAYLGGSVFKKRVAREGAGKSSGFRVIVAVKSGEKSFFIHLFAKNKRANIDQRELADLKEYAKILLGMSDEQIRMALDAGALEEII